ncbi:MAG: hypothetical protein RSG77_27335, partial [Hafnia sp.]
NNFPWKCRFEQYSFLITLRFSKGIKRAAGAIKIVEHRFHIRPTKINWQTAKRVFFSKVICRFNHLLIDLASPAF